MVLSAEDIAINRRDGDPYPPEASIVEGKATKQKKVK